MVAAGDALEKIEVLLVDDREENLLSLEAVLASPDYRFARARSGDEALRYLLGHTPALILMDVQMPELNGFETAAIIKGSRRTREIPIIFITAINNDEHFAHQGYAHGAVDYIYKPYDAEVLKAKVAVFASIKRQQARVARLVSVQRAATEALAESSDVKEAVAAVLSSVCTSLRWDLGMFWRADRHAKVLTREAEWSSGEPAAPRFLAESARKPRAYGEDLPGKVCAARSPLWLEEIQLAQMSPRLELAAREGLRSAVALPVFVHEDTYGAFEFYSRSPTPEDPDLVKIMHAIGSQVGQVLKRTEAFEWVRVSEARKAAILDTALDCIISMDHLGRIVEFNPAAEATFGRSRAEALGMDLAAAIMPPSERDAHHRGLERYLSTGRSTILGKRVEMNGMRTDGTEFQVEIAVSRVPGVEPPLFTGILRDITERARAQRNSKLLLEASAALSSSLEFEKTFAALSGLVVASIADCCLIDLFEAEGKSRTVAVAHADRQMHERARRLQRAQSRNWEGPVGAPHVLTSGKPALYAVVTPSLLESIAAGPLHLEALRELEPRSAMVVPLVARGKTLGAMTLLSSKANRAYVEADLVFAEELGRRAGTAADNARLYEEAQKAVQVRDEFFSIASHELKTPITALKMLMQVTQRSMKLEQGGVPSVEKLVRMFQTSNRQVDQLTHLVDDLVDVVKIRAGRLTVHREELNLSTLIEEVIERYADALAAAKCELRLKVDPDIEGSWDRTRIEQVVVNLLSNAIKYAPGKPIAVRLSGGPENIELVVEDRGPGIPADRHAKIFDRFERATESRYVAGLGLGLYIVRQIVEAHGGAVRLDSRVGRGSKFVVELPRREPPNVVTQGPRDNNMGKAAHDEKENSLD